MESLSKIKYNTALKYLSWILRYKAIDFGLKIDQEGYVKIEDIINLQRSKKYHFTIEMIKEIALIDKKGRYQIKEEQSVLYIRALKGDDAYKIAKNANFTQIENIFIFPSVVYHTDSKTWRIIENNGISKMNKAYIKFSLANIEDDSNKEISIEINALQAYYNDISFTKLDNQNIIQSSGIDGVIPVEYIKQVYNKNRVIYVQNFSVFIYYTCNKICIYNSQTLYEEFENKNSQEESEVLNSIAEFLHNENMMRFPMIVVVNKNLEKKFTQIIQDGIEQKEILYPSVYVDYITLEKGKNISEEIAHGEIRNKKIKKVDLNWKNYYSSLINEEI